MPAPFIRANANKFQELITLETPHNSNHLWPVEVIIRPWGDRLRVMLDGHDGGWKKFVVDNEVKIGDTLIFKLVAMSRFVVQIHRAAKNSSEACSSSNHNLNTGKTDTNPPAATSSFGGKELKWRKRDVLDILLDPYDDQNHESQMDNNINSQTPEIRSQFSPRGRIGVRSRLNAMLSPQRRKPCVYEDDGDDSTLPNFIKTLCVSHLERNGRASSAKLVSNRSIKVFSIIYFLLSFPPTFVSETLLQFHKIYCAILGVGSTVGLSLKFSFKPPHQLQACTKFIETEHEKCCMQNVN